jgi:hypothetical protein
VHESCLTRRLLRDDLPLGSRAATPLTHTEPIRVIYNPNLIVRNVQDVRREKAEEAAAPSELMAKLARMRSRADGVGSENSSGSR